MSIANFLINSAKHFPDRPAISIGKTPYFSYKDLMLRSQSYAVNFRRYFGLVPLDSVAIILDNSAYYLEILYGSWLGGFSAVPINSKLHPKELAFILGDAQSKLCFTSGALAGKLEALVPNKITIIDITSREFEKLATSSLTASDFIGKWSDPAWVFYTSGTTGKPKGVVLTHSNLRAMTSSYFASVDSVRPDDSILHAAPMSHASGLYNFPHIFAGANNIIPESGKFDSHEIFDITQNWQGVGLFAAPTMVNRMVTSYEKSPRNLSGLKTIIFGGGPMYLNDLLTAKRTLGPRLVQIYGQGESPNTITSLSKWHINDENNSRFLARIGSVGVPQIGVTLKIVNDNDKPLPQGELGEVIVRSEVVMSGYWRNEFATKEALRNGWLHTGDIGSLDKDGFLTLHDRSKDLIISGGSNIYPREVEEILLKHPDVTEVSVVGKKNKEWGEEVCAFVVANNKKDSLLSELDQLCLAHIARFKRPKEYKFIEALPKNNYGKVLKTRLRTML